MQEINPKHVSTALDEVNGNDFEAFAQAFFPAASGLDFLPLGGVKDGGADGFVELTDLGVKQGKRTGSFIQVTIQADHNAKIRQTVKRLKGFGRKPKSLIYITSRLIPHIDVVSDDLTDELGVMIRIRDRKYIETNINKDLQTVAAFNNYLKSYLDFTNHIGGSHILPVGPNEKSTSVFVFLQQELERRHGNAPLLEATADSLILWALEGTDPDKKQFMNRDDIIQKVEGTIPSAKQILRGVIDHRLKILSSKSNGTGREIRQYKKDKVYCLPFETRELVSEENIKDASLRSSVLDHLSERAADVLPDDDTQALCEDIAKVSLRAVEKTFECEGLEFAAFLHSDERENSPLTVSDHLDAAIDERNFDAKQAMTIKLASMKVLRGAFYNSTREERLLFGKLSRTYSLLFAINSDPEVITHFKKMAGKFYLVIGSDLLIRVLSENYLSNDDMMTTNLLKILSETGSKLVLTEPVLDEVYSHICTSDWEFKNVFKESEQYVNSEMAQQSRRILVRAYFYAKLGENTDGNRPKSWGQYISRFCDYQSLHSGLGKEQIRSYLMTKLGLEFEEFEDLAELTDDKQVETLKKRLMESKSKEVLAYNDALIIHYIYGRRKKLGERSVTNQYGYRTWWLTHEASVRKYTKDLVAKKGCQYIMRPEFLLNFISLAPSAAEVRKSYQNVFPTLLGIRLSDRIKETVFLSMMKSVNEAQQHDDARVHAKVREMTNLLMADMVKKYDKEFSDQNFNDPF